MAATGEPKMSECGIERFIEDTNRAKTSKDIASLFGNALKNLGYDRFCYSRLTDHPSMGLRAGHGIAGNYPEGWMSHYQAHRYDKTDPVRLYGAGASQPYTWDSLLKTCQLKPAEKQVMDEAKEARLFDGIAVPIRGPNGELAGVGMASSTGRMRPDRNLLGKLHALAFQFHLAYTGLEQKDYACPEKTCRLTGREKEILLWAAEGKSDSIIAEILGVSHSTIRFHMNNIFKKLDTNERTFATVKAIRQGLIVPSAVT